MSSSPRIRVEHVSKTFKLPHEKNTSIKGAAVNFYKRNKSYETQKVLTDISFDIDDGDFFGIVGRNGSGKSTLLKLLAGIYEPTSGAIAVDGKLTPFIELGVGFNPELTGRENVFLNGALLGFNRKEMDAMYEEIVEFAEIRRFMDQKLKNYSSGMQVRLAFSIAIRAKSEILLLDEVLAVGDSNFQKKCFDVFKRIKEEGRTVILVTHDMSTVQNYCTKAMLLDKGKIVALGDTNKVTKQYNDLNIVELEQKAPKSVRTKRGYEVTIMDTWISKNDKKVTALTPADQLDIRIKYKVNQDVQNPVIGITLKDQVGRPVFAINTKAERISTGLQKKGSIHIANFIIDNIYSDGNYYVVPAVTDSQTVKIYDSIEEGHLFSISGWDYPAFLTQPKHAFSINTIQE